MHFFKNLSVLYVVNIQLASLVNGALLDFLDPKRLVGIEFSNGAKDDAHFRKMSEATDKLTIT